MKIIDNDGFTKVVNTKRTPSPILGPDSKIPAPEPKIVELVLDCDEVEEAKTKVLYWGRAGNRVYTMARA